MKEQTKPEKLGKSQKVNNNKRRKRKKRKKRKENKDKHDITQPTSTQQGEEQLTSKKTVIQQGNEQLINKKDPARIQTSGLPQLTNPTPASQGHIAPNAAQISIDIARSISKTPPLERSAFPNTFSIIQSTRRRGRGTPSTSGDSSHSWCSKSPNFPISAKSSHEKELFGNVSDIELENSSTKIIEMPVVSPAKPISPRTNISLTSSPSQSNSQNHHLVNEFLRMASSPCNRSRTRSPEAWKNSSSRFPSISNERESSKTSSPKLNPADAGLNPNASSFTPSLLNRNRKLKPDSMKSNTSSSSLNPNAAEYSPDNYRYSISPCSISRSQTPPTKSRTATISLQEIKETSKLISKSKKEKPVLSYTYSPVISPLSAPDNKVPPLEQTPLQIPPHSPMYSRPTTPCFKETATALVSDSSRKQPYGNSAAKEAGKTRKKKKLKRHELLRFSLTSMNDIAPNVLAELDGKGFGYVPDEVLKNDGKGLSFHEENEQSQIVHEQTAKGSQVPSRNWSQIVKKDLKHVDSKAFKPPPEAAQHINEEYLLSPSEQRALFESQFSIPAESVEDLALIARRSQSSEGIKITRRIVAEPSARKRHRLKFGEVLNGMDVVKYEVVSASKDFSGCFFHACLQENINFKEICYIMKGCSRIIKKRIVEFTSSEWSRGRIFKLCKEIERFLQNPNARSLPYCLWSPMPLMQAFAVFEACSLLVINKRNKDPIDCKTPFESETDVICERYDSNGIYSVVTSHNLEVLKSDLQACRLRPICWKGGNHWSFIKMFCLRDRS